LAKHAWIEAVITDFSVPLREMSIPATVRNIGGLTFGSVNDAVDRMTAQPAYMLTDSILVWICFVADDVEVVLPIQGPRGEIPKRGARAL
jgi:hypothetical protein